MGGIDQEFLEYMLMMNVLKEDPKDLIKKHSEKIEKEDLNIHKKEIKKNNLNKKTA